MWMWDDEALPEQHVADKTEDGIDFTTASVGEVVRHFNQSDKKGVSGHNTLVPGKLKSVQDSDVKKEAVMKDVNTGALASALSNVLGGSYVSKDEVAADYEKTYAAPKKEKMRKNDKLANGTYLWDADTLHEGKGGEKRSGEGVKAQSRTRAEQVRELCERAKRPARNERLKPRSSKRPAQNALFRPRSSNRRVSALNVIFYHGLPRRARRRPVLKTVCHRNTLTIVRTAYPFVHTVFVPNTSGPSEPPPRPAPTGRSGKN